MHKIRHARARKIGLSFFAIVLIGLSGAGSALAQANEQREARGLVRSLGEATISSELSARIISMPFREGEIFKSGDLLVVFDCVGLQANLNGAKADMRAANAALETARELARLKATGQREVEQAEARYDRTRADVDAIQARMTGCEVRAPFDGAIVDRTAHPHEVIGPSTPLLRIVDMDRLEIELLVSSTILNEIKPGTRFNFRVDQTGKSYHAHIIRLGAVVDPASQTAKIFGVFDHDHDGVLHGMSGTAQLMLGPDAP